MPLIAQGKSDMAAKVGVTMARIPQAGGAQGQTGERAPGLKRGVGIIAGGSRLVKLFGRGGLTGLVPLTANLMQLTSPRSDEPRDDQHAVPVRT